MTGELFFKGKLILIVDDDNTSSELMKDILEAYSCEIDVAKTGKQAVDIYEKRRPHLILMDVQMPEMDGYQATKEIREIEAKEKLPRSSIIGVTANALSGDREKCIRAGMDDYCAKPFDIHDLRGKMVRLLGGYKWR